MSPRCCNTKIALKGPELEQSQRLCALEDSSFHMLFSSFLFHRSLSQPSTGRTDGQFTSGSTTRTGGSAKNFKVALTGPHLYSSSMFKQNQFSFLLIRKQLVFNQGRKTCSSVVLLLLLVYKRTRTNPLQPTGQTGLTVCSVGSRALVIYWRTFCASLSLWRITGRRGYAIGNSYKHRLASNWATFCAGLKVTEDTRCYFY